MTVTLGPSADGTVVGSCGDGSAVTATGFSGTVAVRGPVGTTDTAGAPPPTSRGVVEQPPTTIRAATIRAQAIGAAAARRTVLIDK
ncbi:hypothetical protein nbrc107697_18000 [Gordonia crocea]|uniref:Uncharacterized protein n=1 Tax=Gordonia crocea TaxID=589162 RepID=A0A7I9UY77_9ACTN|nr:hypothetical protein nbrc107697_18000 [Gordonia crocea]